ncbi:hypothetical protein JCM8208_007444 [Rhodotorula glutinis]
MPRAPHPYGVQGSAALPSSDELRDSLSTRVKYAHFKLAHDRLHHSLTELENLYLRPFHAQAVARAQARRTEERRKRWREAALQADEAREQDGSAYLPLPLDDDVEREHVEAEPAPIEVSAVKLGKRKAVDADQDEHPDLPPRRTRSTRAHPVRPPPPASPRSDKRMRGKAKEFLVRFQGLPSSLDMNAADVHEQPHDARFPAPARVDGSEDDGDGEADTPSRDAPPVLRGRRRSLRSSARAPPDGVGAPSASSFLPEPSTSTSRARTSPAAPPPSALGPSPLPSGRRPAPAPSPSPYSSRSSVAFSHATLAPTSPSPAAGPPSTLSFAAPPPALSSSSSSSRARPPPPPFPRHDPSLALGAHASFSALPPPPLLPFDDNQHPDLVHGPWAPAGRPPHVHPGQEPRADPGGAARAPAQAQAHAPGWGGAPGGPRAREVRAAAEMLFQAHGSGEDEDDEAEEEEEVDEDALGSEEELERPLRPGRNGGNGATGPGGSTGSSRVVSPAGSDDERMPGPEEEDEGGGEADDDDVDAGIGGTARGQEGRDDALAAGHEYPPLSQDTVVDSQEHDEGEEEGAGEGPPLTQETLEDTQ